MQLHTCQQIVVVHIYTKNAVINHCLHLTCLSACSAAEVKTSPSINICLYLATFLVPNMLGSPPMPGDLVGIDLINMPGVIISLQAKQST